MADANNASDHSLLWGYPLEFWDRLGIWALVVGAVLGVVALLLTAASAYILYRVADEAQIALKSGHDSANEKIAVLTLETAKANEKAEQERLERIKLEIKIAPRLLTHQQQGALTERLKQFPNQRGFITTSPMTTESEWFMRVLTAPLKSAGWEIEMKPGTVEPTILQPTGVVIGYAMDLTNPRVDPGRAQAGEALASFLNEHGISATVVPARLPPPQTIAITITPK